MPLGEVPLLDLIPRITPFDGNVEYYSSPTWLAPGLDMLEQIIAPRDYQICFAWSAPRGHTKTTSIQVALIKHLLRWPRAQIGYFCHTEGLAIQRSKQIRRAMENMGFGFRGDTNAVREWELETGGGIIAGPITSAGQGRHPRIIVVDDPYKKAEDARSPVYRAQVISAIEDDLKPMLPKDGAIILVHARQHPKDAIGHYKSKKTWVYLNQKALTTDPVTEEKTALWPDQYPVVKLLSMKEENELTFETQYQGEPRTKTGAIFNEPALYNFNELKLKRYRVAYGYDCAYTDAAQRRGDWSVIVKMYRELTDKPELDRYYVVNVFREQIGSVDFLAELKRQHKEERGPMHWLRAAGPEKGVFDLMNSQFKVLRSTCVGSQTKYSTSQPVSKAWNRGLVLVPGVHTDSYGDVHQPPGWVEPYRDEMDAFTGTEGGVCDDQADATAGAYHVLSGTVSFASIQQSNEMLGNSFSMGSRFGDMQGRGYG